MSDQHTFFLVIEGLDGSGKSEISRRLAELMRATLDDRVMLTFEPHDPSAAGLYIRRVLRKKILVSSHTLALAFALNRSDHNERVIGPFLDQNNGPRLVLCDRYVLSSLVYNTSHDLPMQAVWDLNSSARRPDLTLFLDASAEICYARMGSRGGNRELFESNLAESRTHYFDAIGFLRQQGEPVAVVDANPDLLIVLNSIIDVLRAVGPRWLTLQKLMFLEATAPAMLAPPPLELDRWMRDFVDRYSVPVLAEAVLDDGVRRLVSSEVNSLSLDELTALMMNFLQVDRRYRFESAWPGQPIDYTIIRPGGETGGLVILQDERRWEGVMRALESEFIAPHYSIRRDSIQFVVALDPSHAGEEVAQFVPDTGSVPVEVYGRGTLIQYFTRYITRRVSAEYVAPAEPPQLSMPLPEGDPLINDWSLAAAQAAPPLIEDEPPPAPPRPSRTATQEMWFVQQDYVPGPEEYQPMAADYYQEQEGHDQQAALDAMPLAYFASSFEADEIAAGEIEAEAEGVEAAAFMPAGSSAYAIPPAAEAGVALAGVDEQEAEGDEWSAFLPPDAPILYEEPGSEDLPPDASDEDQEALAGAGWLAFMAPDAPAMYAAADPDADLSVASEDDQGMDAFEPASGTLVESPLDDAAPDPAWGAPDLAFEPPVMDYDTGDVAAIEEAAAPAPESGMPWASFGYSEATPDYAPEPGEYSFAPPPESEMPLTPADIDTGADVIADGYAFAPLDFAAVEEPPLPPTKWDTREDLAAVNASYGLNDDDADAVAEAPAARAAPLESGFDFDLPAREGDPLAELYAATAVTQAEMDAIAALYTGLDDALRDQRDEPDAEQEEELG